MNLDQANAEHQKFLNRYGSKPTRGQKTTSRGRARGRGAKSNGVTNSRKRKAPDDYVDDLVAENRSEDEMETADDRSFVVDDSDGASDSPADIVDLVTPTKESPNIKRSRMDFGGLSPEY